MRRVAMLCALGALLISAATAAQADAAKRTKAPVVKRVAPMKVFIGQTMSITGRNFRRGKGKNSVVFKRDGARAVFVKADIATTKLIKVTLPAKLAEFLRVNDGVKQPTKFRIRILAGRLGKRFTRLTGSPSIGPEQPPVTEPGPAAADGDCDGDRQLNGVDADDDNDMLSDEIELRYGLDSCKLDSDADGVQDGYEYRSALDLNDDEHQQPNTFLPYPGKRPYPNPLDGTDAGVDFDGDGLALEEEESLWLFSVEQAGAPRSLDALTYSDGEQFTLSVRGADGHRVPTMSAAAYGAPDGDSTHKHGAFLSWAVAAGYQQVMLQEPLIDWYVPRTAYDIRDFNRDGAVSDAAGGGYVRAERYYFDSDQNGWMDDGERDEDADGMTNFQEAKNCMVPSYWSALYDKETPYYRNYSGTRLDDSDSDGDGVRDGADDQDADDVPNVMECSRQAASGRPFDSRVSPPDPPNPLPLEGQVNPFNPCLPSPRARTCNNHPGVTDAWAPFALDDKYYYVFN